MFSSYPWRDTSWLGSEICRESSSLALCGRIYPANKMLRFCYELITTADGDLTLDCYYRQKKCLMPGFMDCFVLPYILEATSATEWTAGAAIWPDRLLRSLGKAAEAASPGANKFTC